jgi:hypothetical protein
MATSNAKATQDFIPVKEVRDGIMVLKDGSLRAIVMVSSLNFALKSPDEQDAIIYQFQNFLNSLDFSVQICIQSRELDIRPYIALLEERLKNELNELLRMQIKEYVQFVRAFVEQSNIMTKTFFTVIPYSPSFINQGSSPFSKFSGSSSNKEKQTKEQEQNRLFEESRTQLEQRTSVVQQGLTRCGLTSIQLGTDEMVELLYKTFNPGDMGKPAVQ